MPKDQIDHRDPRSILEEAELEAEAGETRDQDGQDRGMRHVMAWILEGKTLIAVATRVYVAAYVGSPDVVQGMTLHQIASLSGKGRSATHNLAREFEQIFNVKSIHARSEEARRKYSDSFHRRNGTAPHTYNPQKS